MEVTATVGTVLPASINSSPASPPATDHLIQPSPSTPTPHLQDRKIQAELFSEMGPMATPITLFCLRVVSTRSVWRRYGTNEFHLQLHLLGENLSINGR